MLTLVFLLFAESVFLDDKSGLSTEVDRSYSNEVSTEMPKDKNARDESSSKPTPTLQSPISSKKKAFTIGITMFLDNFVIILYYYFFLVFS